LVHVETYRYYGHFEGDAITYRGPNEAETVKAEQDCILMFRRRVSEAGLLDPAQLDEIERESKQLIDEAVAEAKAAPPPAAEALLTDVYVTY
jgi:pyruvate dehydrogenase E1 component alpha subunit